MGVPIVDIRGFECNRCWYRWAPRTVPRDGEEPTEMPLRCPKCKTSYWNRPRKNRLPAGAAAARTAGGR